MKLLNAVKDKANEPIRVWHLVVTMIVAAWFMTDQFTTAMSEVYAIRKEVEEQQAAQSQMIVGALKAFGIDLGVEIKDLPNVKPR